MSEKQEEEAWRPYRHSLGYSNRGPLGGSRPAPYIHRAVCSKGELGTWFPRDEKPKQKPIAATPQSLTHFGRRILRSCPPEGATGISERTLIEKLNGLSGYADYQRGIAELIEAGYLTQDPEGRYKRTN